VIWIFASDLSSYFVVCRGLCLRTYHEREDHGLPSWRLYALQRAYGAFQAFQSDCFQLSWGAHYVGRPGKPPHLDTIWPRFDLTEYPSIRRYQPFDDVPWEIHTIDDDVAREAAYHAYTGENGAVSSDSLKRRLIFALRLAMISPVLVQEIV